MSTHSVRPIWTVTFNIAVWLNTENLHKSNSTSVRLFIAEKQWKQRGNRTLIYLRSLLRRYFSNWGRGKKVVIGFCQSFAFGKLNEISQGPVMWSRKGSLRNDSGCYRSSNLLRMWRHHTVPSVETLRRKISLWDGTNLRRRKSPTSGLLNWHVRTRV